MTLNTRKTDTVPNGEDWQMVMKFDNFPILPSTKKAFQQLMRKTSLSFNNLAKIAEQDPAMCLHMLLCIRRLSPANLDQISTAAGCISLLGMEEVVRLIKRLPVLASMPQAGSERAYMSSLHCSVLAGRLAAQWAQYKPGLNQHQAQWAAMLASAPLWPWQLRQVSASHTSFNQLSQGKDIIPALEKGFGPFCESRLETWKKLAQQLQLPTVCLSLWQNQCWPEAKDFKTLRKYPLAQVDGHKALKLKCQQPELLIYFANALANQYRFGAYRYKSQRWLHISAHFLNKDADKIHHDVIRLSQQLAQEGRLTTVMNGLLSLRHSSLEQVPVYECISSTRDLQMERESPNAISASKSKERKIDQALLKDLIQQLTETPESFGDWHYLMRSLLNGVTKGIGLKHSYIMVQNKLGTAAKVYYQQGLAETDPLCHFCIALDKASIFKKMLEKPASLMITDQNRSKMLRGISPTQQNVLPQQFMMMSLFSNERPIGIIFADLGGSARNIPMQPSEYMAFKSLCMAANKSLGKFALANQKKSNGTNSKANQRRA